ncbi:hypothetical protein CLV58_109147 [Spirosoma oryzae]|uniref:Uncharacterized protein n=1 Tax=Spirosoma oryzae TaxID=1469603 RepID=A0A2T0SYD1_9BACT|nr:hypothetical protein [Spirosoma oryzae]PRY38420.1 hypothetical protein CLV58_109147 [Spirosoma oryzae]
MTLTTELLQALGFQEGEATWTDEYGVTLYKTAMPDDLFTLKRVLTGTAYNKGKKAMQYLATTKPCPVNPCPTETKLMTTVLPVDTTDQSYSIPQWGARFLES